MTVYNDNKAALQAIKSEDTKSKLRHCDIKGWVAHYMFKREVPPYLEMVHQEGKAMVADTLTKALPPVSFIPYKDQLGVGPFE